MRVFFFCLILLSAWSLSAELVYHADGRATELMRADGITATFGTAPANGPVIKQWNADGLRYLIQERSGGLPVYRYGAGYLIARPELFWRGTGDVAVLAKRYGLTLAEILPGYKLYKFTVAGDAVVTAQHITEAGHGWAFPNLVREVRPRLELPKDEYYADYQWSFNNDGSYNDAYGDPVVTLKRADIRFEDALRFLMKVGFEPGKYTTKIAIMDSGVVTTHPDLIGDGGKMDPGYDAIRDEAGADPHIPDGATGYELAVYAHGTDCAGITAAEQNDIGVIGVCPWCGLYPVLALEGTAGSAISEEMYLKTYERFVADPAIAAVNCSFGPTSEYGDVPLMPGEEESHLNFMQNGRGGKGGAIMYASGNDGVDTSYDGLFKNVFEFERDGVAVSHRVIIVGATSAWDTHIDYSNWGMELGVSAPSLSSYPVIGIATTHIPANGDLGNDYTATFSGTSAATPVITGAMGFIFSLNPDLTLEEAENILYTSADKINPETGFWDDSGFSPKFGHGRLNLHKAARLALGYPMCDPLTVHPEERNGLDDDCDGWVDEEVSPTNKMGAPCKDAGDCTSLGYSETQVACVTELRGYTFPGGYCLIKPSGAPCPEGGALTGTRNDLSCMRECGDLYPCGRDGYYCSGAILGICLPNCAVDDDCPEGNYCDDEAKCHTVPSGLGGPCQTVDDCIYSNSQCDTSKPGGYCFMTCDNYNDAQCPDNGKCIYSSRSRAYICAAACTSDENCRPDDETDYYRCHVKIQGKEGVCFRPCRGDGECINSVDGTDDAHCTDDGRCVPYGWEAPDTEVKDDAASSDDGAPDDTFTLPVSKSDGSSCALILL